MASNEIIIPDHLLEELWLPKDNDWIDVSGDVPSVVNVVKEKVGDINIWKRNEDGEIDPWHKFGNKPNINNRESLRMRVTPGSERVRWRKDWLKSKEAIIEMEKVNISTWWMLVASKKIIGEIWDFFDFVFMSHWKQVNTKWEIRNTPKSENDWEYLFWIKFIKLSEGAEKLINPTVKNKKPTSIVSDTVVNKEKDWRGRGNLERLGLNSTVYCENTDKWLNSSNDRVIKVTEKWLLIESEKYIAREIGTRIHLKFILNKNHIYASWIVTKMIDESEKNNTRTFFIKFTDILPKYLTHISETIWI